MCIFQLNIIFCFVILEFMQPQHIWPYLQQNFIHHPHFPHPAFLTQHHNGNSCQPQTTLSSSPGSTISDSDNHSTCTTNSIGTNGCCTNGNNNNNNNGNNNNGNISNSNFNSHNNDKDSNEEDNNRRQTMPTGQEKAITPLQQPSSSSSSSGDPHMHPQQPQHPQAVIAKPLPSRPTPFLPHSMQHPHLHSLLAHCRNPYLSGKSKFKSIYKLKSSLICVMPIVIAVLNKYSAAPTVSTKIILYKY